MKEFNGVVTMGGNPVTLYGNEVRVGDKAPGFVVQGNDLGDVKLSDFEGKVVVISVVPSLDTPVCDLQTKRFNNEASNFGDDIAVLTISMDLPFAQKRWCGASDATNVITLSDHRTAEFGENYGVLIKGARLLARSVFVVDKNGQVVYREIVKEVREEPDYECVLKKLQKLV